MPASFLIIGPAIPESPVLLSVPHAGRDYPDALCAALRAPVASLRTLEDRHVDAIALAARERETLLLQTLPRAWIDLNRAEDGRAIACGRPQRSPRPSAERFCKGRNAKVT